MYAVHGTLAVVFHERGQVAGLSLERKSSGAGDRRSGVGSGTRTGGEQAAEPSKKVANASVRHGTSATHPCRQSWQTGWSGIASRTLSHGRGQGFKSPHLHQRCLNGTDP